MLDRLIFDNTTLVLGRAAQFASQRQVLIANNVANADTPGFIRQDMAFKDQLAAAIDGPRSGGRTEREEVLRAQGRTYTEFPTSLRMDGNSVNMDTEMARLSENALEYVALMNILGRKVDMVKTVLRTGR